MAHSATEQPQAHMGLPLTNGKLAMWFFLITEIMFFTALIGTYLLLRQRDWFGLVAGGAWLSFSTFELATYVADANKGNLALVGFGDNVLHDWDTLLTQWHVLNHCEAFAFAFRVMAVAVSFGALALGGWLLWTMHLSASDNRSPG